MSRPLQRAQARPEPGFSLVELMVAMALGLLVVLVLTYVYVSSRASFARQAQVSGLQQSIRTAFDFLATDIRMAGHLGCGGPNPPSQSTPSPNSFQADYATGLEGYDFTTSGNAYTLSSDAPANDSTVADWSTNAAPSKTQVIPLTTLSSGGLTPGSDVLVARTVSGPPIRMTTSQAAGSMSLPIEALSGTGTACSGASVSDFCANSHGVISSCQQSMIFQVDSVSVATKTLNLPAASALQAPFAAAQTEIFPLQVIAYYVKLSTNGKAPSLYRRVFEGQTPNGVEQELVEGVESMQVLYGIDNNADGVVDAYVVASAVTNWSKVLSARISLLIRALDPVTADLGSQLPTTGRVVNDVTLALPTGSRYERQVFTTTVALRNHLMP